MFHSELSLTLSICSLRRSSTPLPPCHFSPEWWLRMGRLHTKHVLWALGHELELGEVQEVGAPPEEDMSGQDKGFLQWSKSRGFRLQ